MNRLHSGSSCRVRASASIAHAKLRAGRWFQLVEGILVSVSWVYCLIRGVGGTCLLLLLLVPSSPYPRKDALGDRTSGPWPGFSRAPAPEKERFPERQGWLCCQRGPKALRAHFTFDFGTISDHTQQLREYGFISQNWSAEEAMG